MTLSETNVTIVGLGLMGGSLALALREKCAGLTGVDSDPATLELARRRKVVDFVTGDFMAGVARADLLVLATPVRTILAQLAQLSYSNSPLVLLDLGSTKREICAAMDALPDSFDPLGGHPMCGKETAGIESAAANLFANAAFVLAPLARTSPKALALAEELVAAVGARPLLLDPARHDNLVAVTSHLPYLLACSLMTAAATDAADDEQLWSVAASGFRDTTRLSASDVRVMADIIATNRDPILAALSRQRAELERLQAILAAGDDSILFEYLSHARGARTAQQ